MATGALSRWVTAPMSKLGEMFLRTPALARAPIALYKAGLGGILGSRMVLLEHTGDDPQALRALAEQRMGAEALETLLKSKRTTPELAEYVEVDI